MKKCAKVDMDLSKKQNLPTTKHHIKIMLLCIFIKKSKIIGVGIASTPARHILSLIIKAISLEEAELI